MIGLKRGDVKVVPYSQDWPEFFEEERQILSHMFPEFIVIDHVGSTSVPGLCAKPLIDMVAAVGILTVAVGIREKLETLGYEYRGGQGRDDRILYVKGPEECRTCMLHIVVYNGEEWNRLVFFRDYLRSHSDFVQEYCNLKKRLAEKYPHDRDAYKKEKNSFIEEILHTIS